jgi:RNA polymerase sigma-70 factor (ECF subfamily)
MTVAVTEESLGPPAPIRADAGWLDRCRAGDRAAWRWLYDRHFAQVYRLALRLGAHQAEAADVSQEVFVRVYRGLASFRGEAAFSTWLYRITLNEVARLRRAGGVRRALASLLGREPDAPAPPRPDHQAEQTEAFRALTAVLDRMKPKQRAVFALFELEELSLAEVAAVVGCGEETVKSRLRHARADFERLRRQRALAPGGPR